MRCGPLLGLLFALGACSGELGEKDSPDQSVRDDGDSDDDRSGAGDDDLVGDADALRDDDVSDDDVGGRADAEPDDSSTDDDDSPDLGDESGPGAVPEGTNPGGKTTTCDASEPGVTPLMKLSTVQYRNTVRDLLRHSGLEQLVPTIEESLRSIPDDSLGDSFRGMDPRVSLEHVQGYFDVAAAIGDAVAETPGAFEVLIPDCEADAPLSESCAEAFLDSFLPLVYRRPVSADELGDYLDLVDAYETGREGLRALLIVALSSPRFVNHVEIDGTASSTSADVLHLTSYEIASRLAYSFWQTMPDAELLAAAQDGSLVTEAGFAGQLERVFEDERARDALWQFWNEWMKLEKFTGFETARPAFQALSEGTNLGEDGHDYYGDMVQEMRDLTALFTFDRSATVADLLSTDISVTPSADLAELYGTQPYQGDGAYPSLPAGTRAGLLQRAALLVSNLEQTNPFHRGAFVRRAVLCDSLPQPDPNSLPPGALDPPPASANLTTRERFEAKVEGNDLCQGCHASFSDIGYVLESFDALGRFRTAEVVYDEQTGEALAELPIEPGAVAAIEAGDDSVVADATELNQRIIESGKVEQCLARNYFGYLARRTPTANSLDACVIDDMTAVLSSEDEGLGSAFLRLAQYETFFQRKVGPR